MLLADQDRSRWNRALIAEGQALVRALPRAQPAGAVSDSGRDQRRPQRRGDGGGRPTGRRSCMLYDQLMALAPSPVVALNRAVAVAEVEGPHAALTLVDALDLDHYYLFHAIRADLLRRLGRIVRSGSRLRGRDRTHARTQPSANSFSVKHVVSGFSRTRAASLLTHRTEVRRPSRLRDAADRSAASAARARLSFSFVDAEATRLVGACVRGHRFPQDRLDAGSQPKAASRGAPAGVAIVDARRRGDSPAWCSASLA